MSSELYEPLLERDLDAIPAAARAFAEAHSLDELYVSVARFAVLAYAPSMHAKRAVMACRAIHELRDKEDFFDWIVECARYAAESRQPWSEPPIISEIEPIPREELERNAGDDALMMIDTAFALIPILGEKGTSALLRMPLMELEGPQTRTKSAMEPLIDRAIESHGAIEDVTCVLACGAAAALGRRNVPAAASAAAPPPYHLARDFAQTLLAYAHPPAYRRDEFLAAVKHNLAHGEDFSAWSLA
ncbi:MAG: hypothetical protein DMF56_21305 [Acidobacteria bacterium]|nr:MAG: hypothetical protein DMF56_21305 [Acidobacteriota bacterium]